MIEILKQNNKLQSPSEVRAFEESLGYLANNPQTSDLHPLFNILRDDCEFIEVMWGLLHYLESFKMEDYLETLIDLLPNLEQQAPEWLETIHFRILNSEKDRIYYKELY